MDKIGKNIGPPGASGLLDIDRFIRESDNTCTHYENGLYFGRWNASVRKYENGRTLVRVFECSRDGSYVPHPDEPEPSSEEDKLKAAVSRARSAIFDLAFGNPWDYFITLTFDQRKVGDRYDYDNIRKHMHAFTVFLWRHGCQWLLVPELHKDGAYHYHGMIQGALSSTYRETKYNKAGEPYDCYQIDGYHKGRSDISPIVDPSRISNYITKYVTKSALAVVPPGAKKYWASRGLSRPEKKRAYITPNDVDSLIRDCAYVSTATDQEGNKIVSIYF